MIEERTELEYKDLKALLFDLNASDQGKYVLCDCPDCGRHEAFMYKNNPYYLHCNRTNNCGFKGKISYEEGAGELDLPKGFTPVKTNVTVSDKQKNELDWMNRFITFYQERADGTLLDEGYRGICSDIIKKHAVDFVNEKMVKFFFERTKSLYKKDYSKSSMMTERNLIFPIRGEKGEIEVLSMRSTINPNAERKEIQIYTDPRETGRDFIVDIPKGANHVVIGESILDGLSFKEIDRSTGVIGLTGYRKITKLKEHILKNKDLYIDKSFLIATDDDIAGEECKEKLKDFFKKEGFQHYSFDFKGFAKDGNEFLQKNRTLFEKEYFEQKRPYQELRPKREMLLAVER